MQHRVPRGGGHGIAATRGRSRHLARHRQNITAYAGFLPSPALRTRLWRPAPRCTVHCFAGGHNALSCSCRQVLLAAAACGV